MVVGVRRAVGWVTLLALAFGCGSEDPGEAWSSPVDFDTARAWVYGPADSVDLLVELARTDEQRSFGLMRRPSLDQGSGMIFLYDSAQTAQSYFWMFNTRMPLDIAFLDSAGRIDTILAMSPCQETLYPRQACAHYVPGIPYWSALEVNQGWFREHGIGVGARVVIDSAGDVRDGR